MVSPGPHVHCSSPVVTFVCVTNESLHMHSELPLVPSVPLLSAHVTQSSELVEPVYLCERANSLVHNSGSPPSRAHVLPGVAVLAVGRSHTAVLARFAPSARGVVR